MSLSNEQDDDRMVPTAEVQRRYGQVSHMWVERRLKDDPTFPKPFYISRRRYWRVADSEEYGLQFVDSDESAFPTTIIDSAFTSEVLPLWA